jgi:hypothetical protein
MERTLKFVLSGKSRGAGTARFIKTLGYVMQRVAPTRRIFTLFLNRDIEPLLRNENYATTNKALGKVGVRHLRGALKELSVKATSTCPYRKGFGLQSEAFPT